MVNKYVNADSVINIINKLKLKAIGQWDIDAALVCKEITKEIDIMQGVYIDTNTK